MGKVGLGGVLVHVGCHFPRCSGVPPVISGYSFSCPSPYKKRVLEAGEMILGRVLAVPAIFFL